MAQSEHSPEGIELPIHIGKRVLEIMEERGKSYTIQAVALRIGMNRKTLTAKLRGERKMYMFELRRIAEALKLSVERIMKSDSIDEEKRFKALIQKSDYKKALEVALYLHSIAVGMTERFTSLNNLGRVYYYLRSYDVAQEHWLLAHSYALKINEKYSDPSFLLTATVNNMVCFNVRKEYFKLEEIIEKVEPILDRDPQKSAIICYFLAKIAERRAKLEEAKAKYYKSLDYYHSTGNSVFIAKAKHFTACFEYRQGMYATAKDLFEEALPELVHDPYANLLSIKELAKTLLKMGDNARAERMIEEAIRKIRELPEEDFSDVEGQLLIILSHSRNDPYFAEQAIEHERISNKIKNIACRFLMEYYERKGDSDSLMKYYREARNFLGDNQDFLDEEEL